MKAQFGSEYQSPLVAEAPAAMPTEAELQAIWFEQFVRTPLTTDDGRSFRIIQAGNWNHGPGPDFLQAAIENAEGQRHVGAVELHVDARDWHHHGHDTDPAYEDTVLHVVWRTPKRTFFAQTNAFRHVPQVVLADQLVAPLEELLPHLPRLIATPRPVAKPGRCQAKLQQASPEITVALLRAAGRHRLKLKAERLAWRRLQAGPTQTLWEAMAEGLGYARNKVPMCMLARRVTVATLRGLRPAARLGRLYGVAGWLPAGDIAKLPEPVRQWLRPCWESWWRLRGEFDFQVLPRKQWALAGLRPWNRPERRLAALHGLLPRLGKLLTCLRAVDAEGFEAQLLCVRDPFWEGHATFTGRPLARPQRLIGEERARDLLINLFWPLVWLDDPARAERGWAELRAPANAKARVAEERVLAGLLCARARNEALVQQGLLQIYQDYCQRDASQCEACRFPELLVSWADSAA